MAGMMGSDMSEIISARREEVLQDYESMKKSNRRRFLEGDDKATAEYIFPNQMIDANMIVHAFYEKNRRVVSVQKKTKVGADGLMIEIAKLLTTHSDDDFVVNPANVRIITGMSNAGWEKDMIDKAPAIFKTKIFHHGKLSKADLTGMRNGLIIIDEIDTGDKEFQVLHDTLREAGVLDVHHMVANNNRFVFISATMIKELFDLYQWGELHEVYTMTIPSEYIGHKEFLEMGIVREFYSLETPANAQRWVQEDILDNYGTDYRVHLVRVQDTKKKKVLDTVQAACVEKGVTFRNHSSTDRLTDEEINEFFKEPLSQHIVLGVKGFFRRANLIPNRWKLRIGATHELYTKVVDNNVQIQGLTGRMTGYWRSAIEAGHKTGPHRTSIKAIEQYEQAFIDPFGEGAYSTSGFKKSKTGKVTATAVTMLDPKHIANLTPTSLPQTASAAPSSHASMPVVVIDMFDPEKNKLGRVKKEERVPYARTIIQKHRPDIYASYFEGMAWDHFHCWMVKSDSSTYTKYSIETLIQPNALSTSTNVTDKSKNFMMLYVNENQLIISPWKGRIADGSAAAAGASASSVSQ